MRRSAARATVAALVAATLLIVLGAPSSLAGEAKKEAKAEAKRQQIDAMAKRTLTDLFAARPDAKRLFEKASGSAVFDATKVALGISGGGGHGVAVDKKSGARTYMKVGTVGVGFGLGGQNYQVVFFFERQEAFEKFVAKGWEADASASAAAGNEGANAESQFRDGIAYWQISDKGVIAQAGIAGTKYWKAENLN